MKLCKLTHFGHVRSHGRADSHNLCTGTPRNSGLRETEEKQKLNIAYQMFHLTNDRVKWRLTVSNMS